MQVQIFCAISFSASIVAMLLTVLSKQNITLDIGTLLYQCLIVVTGHIFKGIVDDRNISTHLSDNCERVI